MSIRAALLAATSAVGLLLARALDGLGLLPGVAEDPVVRQAALDPRWTALGLLLCLVVGSVAARVLPRSRLLALAVLVGGQLGVVVALEEAARSVSGAPEGGGETGLWLAAACQAVLALLAVTTALIVVLAAPQLSTATIPVSGHVEAGFPPYRVGASRPERRGWSGRGPPRARRRALSL